MSELGQQLIDIVRRKAAESPDYTYTPPRDKKWAMPLACRYVQDGGPGCLIGHALWEAGIIGTDFENATANHTPFPALFDSLQLPLDQSEVHWLREVQRYQDSLRPWGDAVSFADLNLLSA